VLFSLTDYTPLQAHFILCLECPNCCHGIVHVLYIRKSIIIATIIYKSQIYLKMYIVPPVSVVDFKLLILVDLIQTIDQIRTNTVTTSQ